MTRKRDWKTAQLFRRRTVQFWILVVATFAALLAAFWNTADMWESLEDNAREYGEEVTAQMRNTVYMGMNEKMVELVNVADSIAQVYETKQTAAMEEFLTRKGKLLGYDALFLMDPTGTCVLRTPAKEDEPITEESMERLFRTGLYFQGPETRAGFLAGQTMYYAAPLTIGETREFVLVGLRNKDNVQRIISSDAFDSGTLSCIVNSKGEVVLSPTDINPFNSLVRVFQTDSSEEETEELRQMLQNMAAGSAGTVLFTSVFQEELLMAYHPVGINDWFMLTIVPMDLVAGSFSEFFLSTAMIVVGLFLIFLLLLWGAYRAHMENQTNLTRVAYEDDVTGGMNGEAFRERCWELYQEHRLRGGAVVLMNVVHFKFLNDKLGYETGNLVLRLIYESMCQEIQEDRGEFAARSEMDNYFLYLRETKPERIQERTTQLIEAVNRRMDREYPGNRLHFSVGCCVVHNRSLDARIMLDRARLAAQFGGKAGENECVFYRENMTDKLRQEQELDGMFDNALAAREFQVYLQPKVRTDSGELAGAEALVRWQHPERGLIPPGEFIPLLERNGKICQLDFYVFEEVCRMYRRRREQGKPWFPVSVNLSRLHFYEEHFLDRYGAVAEENGVPAGAIEFELTESIFFHQEDIVQIKNSIAEMHRMGFRCSIDDFGFGYSSLGILKSFDVDALKIDRSFFADIQSPKAQEIIFSVIELAGKLHMETVAEGIEQAEQVEFLQRIRCDMIQGYYFSKPLPMDVFEQWAEEYIPAETGRKASV